MGLILRHTPVARMVMLTVALSEFAVICTTATMWLAGLPDDAVLAMTSFTGYDTLALLLTKALFSHFLLSWMTSLTVSDGDEIHQLFVPYRYANVGDWLVNLCGVSIFLIAGYLYTSLKGRAVA